MKLELKHLAPYLPYRLEGIFLSDIHGIVLTLNDYWVKGETKFGNNVPVGVIYKSDSFKPILRPLSDLTKEIEINGKKTIPCNLIFPCDSLDNEFGIFSYQYSETLQKEKLNCCLDYNQWSLLFEWHFDVFGLIEKGLAVDFNTLQNP